MPLDFTFTKESLLKEVMLRLGAPVVCVELTMDHLDMIFEATWRWWVDNIGGVPKLVTKQHTTHEQRIQLDPDIEEVVDVYFQQRFPFQMYFPELFDSGYPWSFMYPSRDRDMNSITNDIMPMSGLLQVFQKLEESERILSADRDWDYDNYSRILTLYPYDASGGTIIVKALSSDLRLELLTKAEQRFLVDWAYAQALEILGNIRSKFDSYPVPNGERSLNGSDLIQRAQEMKEKLEEKAFERFKPFLWLSA